MLLGDIELLETFPTPTILLGCGGGLLLYMIMLSVMIAEIKCVIKFLIYLKSNYKSTSNQLQIPQLTTLNWVGQYK
jgi:hypothetical protein